MQITLTKEIAEAVGPDNLAFLGYSEDKFRWGKAWDVDMSNQTKAAARKLRDLLAGHRHVKRVPARLEDLDRWLSILEGGEQRCKKIKHFDSMLIQYMKTAPKYWLYVRRDDADAYQPYYVSHIQFHPEKKRDGWFVQRAHVSVSLHWEELGQYRSTGISFYEEDVEGLTVGRALADAGYFTETPEMLESYLANRKKYLALHKQVGLQCVAVGVGEPETKRDSSWWRRESNIRLDRDGVGSRVVIDVLNETDDDEDERKGSPPDGKFWTKDACDHEGSADDDDTDLKPGDEDDDEDLVVPTPDIPLAPSLMCFDLKRHARLKIYVDQMTVYEYQRDLASKLILPEEITNLVAMLVNHRGGFKDIVGNKGGGAIILCAGPPGTGKTLTSEVYSESMERPLYSVQCSQLGTDPDELEKELLKVFARAQRWKAILLLDEADVYVARRGSDLTQNAIVGVFLRVLEYYGGVMFLTTNRADLVDDAIASRCLARIDYKVPDPDDQKRIWRTLADVAGVAIDDAEIAKVVHKFPHLSGRDVKNLLKLGSMVCAANGADALNAKTVEFVKQFKPTADGGDE